jgi:maleylpyruvate isomerase
VLLYTYFLSSASYRVRIGLHLKGIAYEAVFVDLAAREQLEGDYVAVNPEGRVPYLVDGDVRLSQALAILEYLDETHPDPPLLPASAAGRARVRQIALAVVADIQPLQNSGPMVYLTEGLGVSDEDRNRWYRHWVTRGLGAVEALVAKHPEPGRFCYGDTPSLADACLVPQVANARRFRIDMAPYPTLARITDACLALEAFQRAAPENQPDRPAS